MAISPLSRTFLVVALVSGTVLSAAVLLWVFDVIPLTAFLGVVVVLFVVEAVVILSAVRRAGQGAARRSSVTPEPGPAKARGTSTVREPGLGVGYDPMERFRPPEELDRP
jgi:hypothetical protein